MSADGWHGISVEIVPLPVKHCFANDAGGALTGRKQTKREAAMRKQTLLLGLQPILSIFQSLRSLEEGLKKATRKQINEIWVRRMDTPGGELSYSRSTVPTRRF